MLPDLAKQLKRISVINELLNQNIEQTKILSHNKDLEQLIEDNLNNIRVLISQLSQDTESIINKGVKVKCFKKA